MRSKAVLSSSQNHAYLRVFCSAANQNAANHDVKLCADIFKQNFTSNCVQENRAEFDILRVFCSAANQNAANHGADVRFKKSRVRDLDWLLSLAKTKTESCE